MGLRRRRRADRLLGGDDQYRVLKPVGAEPTKQMKKSNKILTELVLCEFFVGFKCLNNSDY